MQVYQAQNKNYSIPPLFKHSLAVLICTSWEIKSKEQTKLMKATTNNKKHRIHNYFLWCSSFKYWIFNGRFNGWVAILDRYLQDLSFAEMNQTKHSLFPSIRMWHSHDLASKWHFTCTSLTPICLHDRFLHPVARAEEEMWMQGYCSLHLALYLEL